MAEYDCLTKWSISTVDISLAPDPSVALPSRLFDIDAQSAFVQAFQHALQALGKGDFSKYELVLDGFVVTRVTLEMFTAFKANYPAMLAKLEAYARKRSLLAYFAECVDHDVGLSRRTHCFA